MQRMILFGGKKKLYIYKLKSTNNDEFIWKIIL